MRLLGGRTDKGNFVVGVLGLGHPTVWGKSKYFDTPGEDQVCTGKGQDMMWGRSQITGEFLRHLKDVILCFSFEN